VELVGAAANFRFDGADLLAELRAVMEVRTLIQRWLQGWIDVDLFWSVVHVVAAVDFPVVVLPRPPLMLYSCLRRRCLVLTVWLTTPGRG